MLHELQLDGFLDHLPPVLACFAWNHLSCLFSVEKYDVLFLDASGLLSMCISLFAMYFLLHVRCVFEDGLREY